MLREEKPIQRLGLQTVSSVTMNKGVQIGQYIKGTYAVMSKRYSIPLRELKFDLNAMLENNIDLLWVVSFTVSNATRLNLLGFMQSHHKSNFPGNSLTTLLSVIKLNPTNYNCIYSTPLFSIDQTKKTNTGTPYITFDQLL